MMSLSLWCHTHAHRQTDRKNLSENIISAINYVHLVEIITNSWIYLDCDPDCPNDCFLGHAQPTSLEISSKSFVTFSGRLVLPWWSQWTSLSSPSTFCSPAECRCSKTPRMRCHLWKISDNKADHLPTLRHSNNNSIWLVYQHPIMHTDFVNRLIFWTHSSFGQDNLWGIVVAEPITDWMPFCLFA